MPATDTIIARWRPFENTQFSTSHFSLRFYLY